MDQIKIGAFLKDLRKQKNLTQEQLAEQLGVSGRTVSRWETGNNMPDISLLVELAEFYEVTIPELINGERKSETMNENEKEVAATMADYAKEEKTEMLKSIRNQSLLGVCAIAVLLVLQLFFPDGGNDLVSSVMLFCQTLTIVTVMMICMTSTGLLYKLRKNRKDISIPKPILMVAGAVIAFAAAFIIKYLFNLIF